MQLVLSPGKPVLQAHRRAYRPSFGLYPLRPFSFQNLPLPPRLRPDSPSSFCSRFSETYFPQILVPAARALCLQSKCGEFVSSRSSCTGTSSSGSPSQVQAHGPCSCSCCPWREAATRKGIRDAEFLQKCAEGECVRLRMRMRDGRPSPSKSLHTLRGLRRGRARQALPVEEEGFPRNISYRPGCDWETAPVLLFPFIFKEVYI